MTTYTVTTYRPMSKNVYRTRLHGETVPTVRTVHVVDAENAIDAIRMFSEFHGNEFTTHHGITHSQADPRRGTVGVYAEEAGQ